MITKKCLKLLGSGEQTMPGTGSVCRVFVYLTTLGLGPYILFVKYIKYTYSNLLQIINNHYLNYKKWIH